MEERLIIDDRTTPKGGLWIEIVGGMGQEFKGFKRKKARLGKEFEMIRHRF